MALLWADGFDIYAATADLLLSYDEIANATFQTNGGRYGGGAWAGSSGSADRLYKSLASGAETELWVGFAFYIPSGGSGVADILEFFKSGATEASIGYDMSNNQFKAYRGRRSTLLGTQTGTTGRAAWHWFECRYKIGTSNGEIEIWIDNTQVLTLNSLNNTANAASSIDKILIGDGTNFVGIATSWYVDDLYILNTSGAAPTGRLGDSRISMVVPSSDASPNNGSLSTGVNHWAVVDEQPYNTSDYTDLTNTAGQEERFGVTALPSTPDIIHAVIPVSVREKTNAGNAAGYNLIRSGSSETLGAYTQLTTSWQIQRDLVVLDPATSAAWSASAVGSMKVGYRVA